MARPVTISDERIIETARDLFLEKGIRATVEDVARRLGISEGTIFHRFRTKVDLFRASIAAEIADPDWIQHLGQRAGEPDVRAVLVEIGREALGFYRRLVPLIMMSWSNPGPDGIPPHAKDPDHPSMRALKRVIGYFEAQMRAGRMRRHDPEIVARMFTGSLLHYVWHEIALSAADVLPMPEETYVRGLVNVVWHGVEPAPAPPGSHGRR